MPRMPLNESSKGPPPLSEAEKERRHTMIADAKAQLAQARENLLDKNIEVENGLLTSLRYCGAHDRVLKRFYKWGSRVAGNLEAKGESMDAVFHELTRS